MTKPYIKNQTQRALKPRGLVPKIRERSNQP